MTEEAWLSFPEATQIVRQRLNASVGRAEAIVKQAQGSGEVRPAIEPINLAADDGVIGMDLWPTTEPRFSKDDFLDWLDRNAAPPPAREPHGKKRARARQAIDAIWPKGVPSQEALANKLLCSRVIEWLKADCVQQGLPFAKIEADTILRAAGRK
jgi:hypothetical protein